MIDKVNIGGFTYTVAEKPDLHTVDGQGRKEWLNGHIVYCDLTIDIHPDLPDDIKLAAVMHESLHGILYQAGHDEQNERQVCALGYGLIAFMRCNPDFVRQVMGWTAVV